ncbi:MAG: neutral/alkaline non-lysosomal ceramidase N-terminal domain-containing protein [Planctomycetes bacterium]|nr:neutral/alkaline non-lysosomal ceramidase N-terminal domain-containing protein [Planctomycetota bacterium]MBL7144326.1 neutral/alkaline non-lysosomal ceramidase N-terminal domain-containing protein [Phycisphaerae bacterium]
MFLNKFILTFAFSCLLLVAGENGGMSNTALALEVGVATVDITPPLGMPMRGYASRKELSNGIWDPLYAKSIVLDDGNKRVSFVILDLIGPPPEEVRERIRQKAEQELQISTILFLAIHTHAGPDLKPDLPSKKNPWLSTLERNIYEVINNAVSSKSPVTVEIGYGSADISYDRRVVNPDGTVKMLWSNPARQENTPVDQTVGIIGFKGTDGKWIAILVHYACHPVVFEGSNLKYSAEFPGVMRNYVEKRLGGTCLYLQGACGEINPYDRPKENNQDTYTKLKQTGIALGKEVVRIAESMKPVKEDKLILSTYQYITELKYRYDLKDENVKEFYIKQRGKKYYEELLRDRPSVIKAETPIVLLGEEIAWVGFPGEFFDDFQIALRNRSPISHTFFLGYCNDVFSYFPTIQAASEGGYGASYSTYVEVGAGERLVDNAIIRLHTITGNLKSFPDR